MNAITPTKITPSISRQASVCALITFCRYSMTAVPSSGPKSVLTPPTTAKITKLPLMSTSSVSTAVEV